MNGIGLVLVGTVGGIALLLNPAPMVLAASLVVGPSSASAVATAASNGYWAVLAAATWLLVLRRKGV